MPDGEMRRPPQLWEQRLARTTSVLGAGITSTGATSIVAPTPTPGTGGGVEPAPVLPPPGTFTKPSTPSLIGQVQGINVLWDGLNAAGDLWPSDTSWVEVHMSTTGTAFTPDATTLKGRLVRPGAFPVGGLGAGVTYYFRLRGADPAGNYTEASDAASGLTGLTTSSDYGLATIGTEAVSFNARTIGGVTNTVGSATPSSPLLGDVWLDNSPGTAVVHKVYNGTAWVTNAWGSASIAAGQITALQIAAGAITAGAISANAITGKTITGGTITGSRVTGGTITGGYISGGTINGATITSTSVDGYQPAGTYLTPTDVGIFGSTTIDGNRITTGVINANLITAGTIIGRTVQTSAGGSRLVLSSGDSLEFYSGGTKRFEITSAVASGVYVAAFSGGIDINSGGIYVQGAAVDLPGVYTNSTADAIDNIGITTGNRLRRKTSTQYRKYDITPLRGTLSDCVETARVGGVATINPRAVLDVVPVEFSSIDQGEPTDNRVLGFIADDVADKLPLAVTRFADGSPAGVSDTAILAALLAVVQDQQSTIADLTARIEALEA